MQTSPRSPEPCDISPGTTLWSTNKSRKSHPSPLPHFKLVGLWGTRHMWYLVAVERWCKSTIHIHKSHINPPSPVAHLELSSRTPTLPLSSFLSTPGPHQSPQAFTTSKQFQHPNIMNYQNQENRAKAEKSAQNTYQYHNFPYSNTPVTFSLFQFFHRWIGSKSLLEALVHKSTF